MSNFTKIVRIGKVDLGYRFGVSLFCKAEYKDGRLSITGVEGPMKSGNARGGCGQIDMHEWNFIEYAPGWDAELVKSFRKVWKQYHLNDMQAGTPAQMEVLERRMWEYVGYPKSYYDWALEVLKEEGLEIDNGYKYGSAWLKSEVPEYALDFLKNLPDTDITPAWV